MIKNCILFIGLILCLIISISPIQATAQQTSPVALIEAEDGPSDSCDFLVEEESSDVNVLILPFAKNADPADVKVIFQINEHTPCIIEATTPTKLYFPKSSFSAEVISKDSSSYFRIGVNKGGVTPLGGFGKTNKACLEFSKDGSFSMGCTPSGP